ncbi:MAG TPA: HIT domain-containing protein [Gammaproteobacteria bacterium]|nr:HIT domain-containing protein [Gammaproteobacteria bacterium]
MTASTDGPPALHPQLAADCHVLGRLDGNTLLLQRNAALPWFVLVPVASPVDTPVDLHELPSPARAALLAAADRLAAWVKRHFACDKINVAAIGNLVPQFHLHVVGRRRDDPCWPRPVWGHLPPGGRWTETQLVEITAALRAAACIDPSLS